MKKTFHVTRSLVNVLKSQEYCFSGNEFHMNFAKFSCITSFNQVRFEIVL